MNNKLFYIAVIVICAIILVGGGGVYYLYSTSAKMNEEMALSRLEEKNRQESITQLNVKDAEELRKIGEERDAALKKELKASLSREKVTEERNIAKVEEEWQNEVDNNSSQRQQYQQTATYSNSNSSVPNIYSADALVNAVSSARIYNESGGRLYVRYNGLWIENTMVSGFAPRVRSWNSTGGTLEYQMVGSRRIGLWIDFASGTVVARISDGARNIYFTIE